MISYQQTNRGSTDPYDERFFFAGIKRNKLLYGMDFWDATDDVDNSVVRELRITTYVQVIQNTVQSETGVEPDQIPRAAVPLALGSSWERRDLIREKSLDFLAEVVTRSPTQQSCRSH